MKALLIFLLSIALAQNIPTPLTITPPASINVKAGQTTQAKLSVTVASGYHANSNKPLDSYLIPLQLTWNPGPISSLSVEFPKPEIRKLGFSAKPVSVFTGAFDIVTKFKVGDSVMPGSTEIKGKLHYQACDSQSCLPPRTIEVSLPVEITAKNR